MTTCPRCGHLAEVGRFCTNCGAAVDGSADRDRTDTAERPAVPAAPPPLPPAPSAARYPLFADEVDDAPTRTAQPVSAPVPEPGGRASHRGGSGWVAWVVAAAVLVVVGLVGATLLLSGDGDDERADDPRPSAPATGDQDEGDGAPTPPDGQSPAPPAGSDEPAGSGTPTDVAADATAEVPATAPPGTDVDGARIRYDAAQLLDGDPTTCWRMTGDGTGSEIVLTLAEPTVVSSLGLVNGYAKTAQDAKGRDLDWYAGNRRVLAVQWVLDDGTVVDQDLDETRDVQTVDVPSVKTSSITLRLVQVSRPGKGRSARDNTAVSELSVVGAPA